MEQIKPQLWIVSELFPPDETSTSYILGEIANTMAKKYCVGVICGPEIYDKRKKLDDNTRFHLDESIVVKRAQGSNFDKNTIIGKTLSFILMSHSLMSLLRKYVRNGDKVLMVTNPAPLVLLMSRFKKSIDFELNILVHDVFPENTVPAGLRLPMYGFIKRMFDKAYAKADQLIVLGRDMQEVLMKKVKKGSKPKGNSPRISVIENWADIENIKPQPMPEGEIILEYAGNIGRVQGLDNIINNLPSDVEFHIYGTGSMENTLKRMNHPRVFFHGPYFRSQQNEVLAACHIALVTLQDGMYGLGVPSKTYNILASGRPVLFFGPKNSEIERLVRESDIGYCGWPKKWNKDELIEKGKKARELAEKYYSKNIILEKFLNAI